MNPADVLKYGHLTVLRTVEDLPDSEWETGGVCGVWSVKDIIGHLAANEHLLEEILAPFAGMKVDTPMFNLMMQVGPGAWNDVEAEAYQRKTIAEVRADYEDTCTRIMEQIVPKIPAATWPKNGTLPWYGEEYSLDDYIAYGFYGHKREHTAQINVFKDTLK